MFDKIIDNNKLFVIHKIKKVNFDNVLFFVVVIIIINKKRQHVLKINKTLKFNRIEKSDNFTN